MKKLKQKTRVEPPGNGLDLDLPILVDTVLEVAYGEETPVTDFKKRLRQGGRDYYTRLHDVILECLEDEALVQAELDRYFAFLDELARLNAPMEDGRPLAFERWLAAAVEAFIDEYELEDDRARFLFETERWGLTPPDSAERECGVPLTRVALAKAMSDFVDIPAEKREQVKPGRNDLFPFQPKGNDLAPDSDGMMMLRRLGILPARWDQIPKLSSAWQMIFRSDSILPCGGSFWTLTTYSSSTANGYRWSYSQDFKSCSRLYCRTPLLSP